MTTRIGVWKNSSAALAIADWAGRRLVSETQGSLASPVDNQADNACLSAAITIGSLSMRDKCFSRCEFC
jgi:hypothetical protein